MGAYRMTLSELRCELDRAGITVKVEEGRLMAAPSERLTPELKAAIKAHKPALVSLLEPSRSSDEGCPEHWRHIPVLSPKGEHVPTQDAQGKGLRYRVKLFDRWYIIRFCPNVSETHVEVAGSDGKRRAFADLHELYRWAWAEAYVSELKYRAVN